jgi:hypothetical protein
VNPHDSTECYARADDCREMIQALSDGKVIEVAQRLMGLESYYRRHANELLIAELRQSIAEAEAAKTPVEPSNSSTPF